jgi:pantothenate synthetase
MKEKDQRARAEELSRKLKNARRMLDRRDEKIDGLKQEVRNLRATVRRRDKKIEELEADSHEAEPLESADGWNRAVLAYPAGVGKRWLVNLRTPGRN